MLKGVVDASLLPTPAQLLTPARLLTPALPVCWPTSYLHHIIAAHIVTMAFMIPKTMFEVCRYAGDRLDATWRVRGAILAYVIDGAKTPYTDLREDEHGDLQGTYERRL